MTREKDLVLIHFEDTPLTYARIEEIRPDVKKDWYQVKLLLLQIPVQIVVWILRDVYIDGDPFTMNGKKMRLEKVVVPETGTESSDEEKDLPEEKPGKKDKGTVIRFPGK